MDPVRKILVISIIVILSIWLMSIHTLYAEEIKFSAQVICSLQKAYPHYDCSERWVVVNVDTPYFDDPTGQTVYGFAIIGESPIPPELSVCNFYPAFKELDPSICDLRWAQVGTNLNDGCYLGICLTPLEHELKHLKCDCNWHKNNLPTKKFVITILEKT